MKILPCARAVATVSDVRRVLDRIVKGTEVEFLQLLTVQYLDRDGHVLELLLAAVGGDNHFLQFIARGGVRDDHVRRYFGRDKDADAARRKVLESKSGAFKHSSERLGGAQTRGDRVRFLLTHNLGNIDELQAGLACEGFKRLRERRRGNVGGQPAGSGASANAAEHPGGLRTCKSKPRAESQTPRLRFRRNGGAIGLPYASLFRHSCNASSPDLKYSAGLHNHPDANAARLFSRHNARLGHLDPHALEAAQKGNECFRVVGGENSTDCRFRSAGVAISIGFEV